MPADPSSIENDLRQLHAAALDDALLARLEACADGVWTRLSPAELEFEHRLRAIAPAPLPDSLMASLESKLAGVPFQAAAPKIVRFPEAGSRTARRSGGWWAAAAVALLGALAGSFVPFGSTEKPVAAAPSVRPAPAAPLVPAGFNRDLRETSDEGVIWHSSKQPHRVLKVVYQERVTLKDAAGRTYEVEQPRVEYILVPAKTD